MPNWKGNNRNILILPELFSAQKYISVTLPRENSLLIYFFKLFFNFSLLQFFFSQIKEFSHRDEKMKFKKGRTSAYDVQ